FFFQAEDGIRDRNVTGVQTCALPIFPTMYSDRIIDEELCNSTCQPLRLNRVMSGQVTAPVMNPPAMVVAAAAMVSGSPDGGTAASALSEWSDRVEITLHATSPKNNGTSMRANHAI